MKKKILMFALILILYIGLSNAIKTITVQETDLVSLKPKAMDADADKLSYSFSKPLDKDGKWQTGYGDAGEYTVTITVSDGESSTSQDVLLVVKKKNAGPSIDSFSPDSLDLTISEGDSINFNIMASDLNKDELRYLWKLDGDEVSTNKGYDYKAGFSDSGVHKVNVVVSDGEKEASEEWVVGVKDFDRKSLLDEINGAIVNEGETAELSLPDFRKYNLEYTLSAPLGNDNKWETTYEDAGTYAVEVTLIGEDFNASKTIDVTVLDVDMPHTFKPIGNVIMKEKQKVTIEFEVDNPDNDKIEFFAESLPKGAVIKGSVFEWVPDYDTVQKEGGLDKTLDKFHLLYKPFKLTFVAKSKDFEAKQSTMIIVKDVNRPPLLSDIPLITINEGEEVVIKPEAVDPDGDNLTYSYSGWIDIDRYLTNYEDAGTYKVKVVASDGFLSSEKIVTIKVKDTNRAPIIDDVGKVEINEGEELELMLNAYDPDGDSVNISAELLPRNSTIEDNIFRWALGYDTVQNAPEEIFVMEFIASDGEEEFRKEVNITVHNVNREPKIIDVKPYKAFNVGTGKRVLFSVNATDPDGDSLEYVWKFSLLEQYKAGDKIFRTFKTAGEKKVKVVVSDGEDETEFVYRVKVV